MKLPEFQLTIFVYPLDIHAEIYLCNRNLGKKIFETTTYKKVIPVTASMNF